MAARVHMAQPAARGDDETSAETPRDAWDTRPPHEDVATLDPRVLKLAARLAAVILDPLAIAPQTAERLQPWPAAAVLKMAAHPHFRRPIKTAVLHALELDSLALTPDFFDRLANRPASRLCVLLACDGPNAIQARALELAAAITHRKMIALVLKSERQALQAAIGDEAFLLATREAPMLYAGMSELDRSSGADAIFNEADPMSRRASAISLGLSACARLIESCEPALTPLFAPRMRGAAALAAFTERDCEQTLRFFRRRASAWAAIIG